jgi:type VI secretion system secreted protein Hcp
MKEVLVSSVSSGGSGGEDRLTESVSLNFAEFKVEYKPQKPDGSGDAAIEAAWNIAKNVKA